MNTYTVITVNGKKTFPSSATTVAELKADLVRNGIDVDNMAIQEALTKTLLTSDSQLLPHDVPYRGSTTSNLIFRLTLKEKHIKSGAYTRAQLLQIVDANPDLKAYIHSHTGYNYQSVATTILASEVSTYFASAAEAPVIPLAEDLPVLVQAIINVLDSAISIESVKASNILDEVNRLKSKLGDSNSSNPAPETPNAAGYTDSEIDNIISGLDDPNSSDNGDSYDD